MKTDELSEFVKECKREEESCLYISTMLFIWLRSVRGWRSTFIALPIVLGGIGSWGLLKGLHDPIWVWGTAACSLVAGLIPAIFKALDLDGHVTGLSQQAALFKNLQDRFRQLANFAPSKGDDELRSEFEALVKALENARIASVTPPERFFRAAQKKIKGGDYSFKVDSVA